MNELYFYVGWVVILLVLSFYLATRRNYRDPSSAKNYEEIRNKLATRKLPVKKEEFEEESHSSFGILNILHFLLGLILAIYIASVVISTFNDTLDLNSLSSNTTLAVDELLSNTANFIQSMFVIVIIITIIIITIIWLLAHLIKSSSERI